MKKYMGNKSRILPDIFKATKIAPNKCTIFDAFSGTTNVGQFFKNQGYSVISNDINETSRLLGEVYLCTKRVPSFKKLFDSDCYTATKINRLIDTPQFNKKKEDFIKLNHSTNNEDYLRRYYNSRAYALLVYLSFFASQKDFHDPFYKYSLVAPDFIWRNFCKNGTNSKYFNLVSQKSIVSQIKHLEKYMKLYGNSKTIRKVCNLLVTVYTPPFKMNNLNKAIVLLENYLKESEHSDQIALIIKKLSSISNKKNNLGNRMFFSEQHGHRIDTINNLSLLWLKEKLISKSEYNFIQCSLVESVALFSNTSATYQAFYKTLRANTLQKFRLVFPEIYSSNKKHKVYCSDTFSLISSMKDSYDIIYLDPPYNWRIYDSNYHLLNLLSDYHNIADSILEYESGIAGAAGENRKLIRTYTNYNRRDTFENLLFNLILAAKCKYVIISYSDSLSNHNKNSLSSINKIETFLKNNKYFKPNKFKKIEVNSVNFESRKRKQKENIHELLFIAEKKNSD